jgi:serine/threonine protein kinase
LNLYYNDIDDADYCALSPLLHTENYMPPIIKGVIQDDMWSLGITLLEVIHGENPFARWNSGGRHFSLMRWEPEIPIIRSPEMHELIQDL